ncbi:MAG: PIG-L deacetylase family protein [Candidatus Limnocylindrales bacterium]
MTDETATVATIQPHLARPERAMVIVAHPDDADFGPAGTMARWIDAGTIGHLVCCTSGDAGGDDPDIDPLVLAATREAEQRSAAAIIGYEGVTFLHAPDGALANDLPLREQLVTVLRQFRPDAVLTMDPSMMFSRSGRIQHTDHRAAAMAAVDAVYPAARNAMAFPHLARAGLAPHTVHWLYLFWTDGADVWVDTSATFERKLTALRAHASQIREPGEFEARMRAWAAEDGARLGVAAAEGFRLLDVA